ncbi:MAG: exodeoxyribonuclease III [Treponema sp.]|nr:exodeoxyribonuclease III [Treponema sp.]
MKIISWNVNGLRAVEKKGFTDWLLNCGADVVCIQETKAQESDLSPSLLNPSSKNNDEDEPLFAGALSDSGEVSYAGHFSSAVKKGYSGTAVYSRTEPDKLETLGIKEFDDEGRTVIAYFGKTAVISAYFPNSQEGGARLSYKLAFCDAIFKKCTALVNEGYNIVLCGDYNIAHTAIDLANPKSNEKNAGYLPEERDWMTFFTSNGFTDTFRMFNKEGGNYTWWSYRFNARAKDIGWRIDYCCVNDSFAPKVKQSVILKDITGSDHCPVLIEVE